MCNGRVGDGKGLRNFLVDAAWKDSVLDLQGDPNNKVDLFIFGKLIRGAVWRLFAGLVVRHRDAGKLWTILVSGRKFFVRR